MKTTNENQPSPLLNRSAEEWAAEAFASQGYYVSPQLIPAELCRSMMDSFAQEVKTYRGGLMRVTTARTEEHYISDEGLMVNPILNIHQLNKELFPEFRRTAMTLLSYSRIQSVISELIQDVPVLIQSGYFESSLGSVPHIDSYFFDSEDSALLACWIALEDISPNAGQLIVYPESHKLGFIGAYSNEVNRQFQNYEDMAKEIVHSSQIDKIPPSLSKVVECRKLLNNLIHKSGLAPFTPKLKRGDVVFFSSKTIHGSEIPNQGSSYLSRNSLVAHFAPMSQDLIRYGTERSKLKPYTENGIQVEAFNLGNKIS